jgi:hypothetical protein
LRKTLLLLIITVFSVVFNTSLQAQTPDFTGTWVLNMEKSKLDDPPQGMTSSIFVIKQEDDHFKITIYHIFGEKKRRIRFKMTADGKTRSVKLIFKGKLEKTTNGLKASLFRKNFLNVVDYGFGASENEFIADEVFTGLPRDHHSIWVFDRKG